jgi:hypothetical protein
MKKSVLLLAAAFGVSSAFAQDLTSKKGEPFLPEAGDWAIGIDAAPFLNYAGQLLSNGGAIAPGFNFLTGNTQTIVGKMFKDEKTAYRAGLRIGLGSNSEKNMVSDRTVTTAPTFPAVPTMKENTWKSSTTAFGLSGGLEFRRGKTRLQGYYGGELGFYMKSTKDKFTYGNALTPATATPAVTVAGADDFGIIADNIGTDTYGNASRVTERKNGSMISLGVRGFIGAEYFILPKISIAGEFGWGVGLTSNGKTSTTSESVGVAGTSSVVGSQTIESGKSGSFRIDTDNKNSVWGPTSTLRLNLHF